MPKSNSITPLSIWEYVTRALTAGIRQKYCVASLTAQLSALTERNTNNTTPTTLKLFQVPYNGNLYFRIYALSEDGIATVTIDVYINSVLTVTKTTTSISYVMLDSSLLVRAGDFVEFRVGTSDALVSAYVKNCILYYTVTDAEGSVLSD